MKLYQAVRAYQTIAAQLTASECAEVEAVRVAVLAIELRETTNIVAARCNTLDLARDYAENLILTRNV